MVQIIVISKLPNSSITIYSLCSQEQLHLSCLHASLGVFDGKAAASVVGSGSLRCHFLLIGQLACGPAPSPVPSMSSHLLFGFLRRVLAALWTTPHPHLYSFIWAWHMLSLRPSPLLSSLALEVLLHTVNCSDTSGPAVAKCSSAPRTSSFS